MILLIIIVFLFILKQRYQFYSFFFLPIHLIFIIAFLIYLVTLNFSFFWKFKNYWLYLFIYQSLVIIETLNSDLIFIKFIIFIVNKINQIIIFAIIYLCHYSIIIKKANLYLLSETFNPIFFLFPLKFLLQFVFSVLRLFAALFTLFLQFLIITFLKIKILVNSL